MLLVAEEQHETESRFLFRTIGGEMHFVHA